MAFRPSKWIVGSPVALLPFIAAFAFNSNAIRDDIGARALAALGAAGSDWATLTVSGRDLTLGGSAPSDEAAAAAAKAAAETYGVRLVENDVHVVPPPPLAAPVIDKLQGQAGALVATGSWQEGVATTLKATLGTKSWTLGKDADFTSAGQGKWQLKLPADLAPGTYDLQLTAADDKGRTISDESKDEITVLPPPDLQAPTVDSVESNSATPEITGTWPSAAAKSLTVTVGQTPYMLGKDAELSNDGDAWKLKLAKPLADGSMDVMAEVSDGVRTAKAAAPGHLLVDTTPPAAPEATAATIASQPFTLTGKWAEGDAVSLVVKLADRIWTLGKDAPLTSDGKGNWSLTPDMVLQPGTYDLGVETRDKLGNAAVINAKGAVVVPQPPEMKAPTVESVETSSRTPDIKGTWPSTVAKSLTVKLGETPFVLGNNPELTANGDAWSLKPAQPLPDGTFEVTAEAGDGTRTVGSIAPGHILVDSTPPAAPHVAPISVTGQPFTISGSWAEGDAVSLVTKLGEHLWALGKDKALASDGKGTWSLTPDVTLAPGSYDLTVETTDKLGNASTTTVPAAVVIAAPQLPPLARPTVNAVSGDASPAEITGTWDEANAQRLTVGIPASNYDATLGKDAALTSDGKGNWKLALPQALPPGVYDVSALEMAADGRSASDASTAEIYIKAPAPAVEPPPAPPVPAPKALAVPTIVALAGDSSPSAITGTWDEGNATKLTVGIPAIKFSAALEPGSPLTSDGKGNWSLAVPQALPPGIYDVTAVETAADGRSASDASTAEIYIKAPPPAPTPAPAPQPAPPPDLKAPTVSAFTGATSPVMITGTWDIANAPKLSVAIPAAKIAASLGDAALITDADGHWALQLPQALPPGTYDVTAVETAADGRTAADATQGEITVQAAPPPAPPPFDCGPPLADLQVGSPILFAFDDAAIRAPHDATVQKIAALLMDDRCEDVKTTVFGRADYVGDRRYNIALSIRRAQAVVNALAAAGVDPARLSVDGLGKDEPIDPRLNDLARAANRSVIVTIVK